MLKASKSADQTNEPQVEPDHIVFYWTGTLPVIAGLSILSALNRTNKTLVHVFLDSDEGFQSSVPAELKYLSNSQRLIFVNFRLSDWVRDEAPKRISRSLSRIRSLACAALNRLSVLGMPNLKNPPKLLTRLLGQWHPLFGWSPLTDPLFSIKFGGPAYRSDVFRVLVASKFKGESVLYSDLDVYFSKPLAEWPLAQSFTYRWENHSWANSAVLFFHKDAEKEREFLVGEISSRKSALPWFLFSEEGCKKAGIKVLEVESFDPCWSSSSIAFRDFGLLFRRSDTSDQFLAEIESRFFAVHWHNQWGVLPETGSSFSRLLEKEYRIFAN